MKKAYTGSITVFFSMTVTVIILFFGSLLLLSRIQMIRQSIRVDLDSAAASALAEYDRSWVKEYGLYTVPVGEIQRDLEFYIEQNRKHGWGEYQLQEISIQGVHTLAESVCLQNQILSFMKERGVFKMLEEVKEMVGQIQEADQKVKNTVGDQELEDLVWVQSLYAQLITDLEGINENGSQNPYAINRLFETSVSYEKLQTAVQEGKAEGATMQILETAYGELMEVEQLCKDAVGTAQTLCAAIRELKNPDQLPITAEELERDQETWKANQEICHEAVKALQQYDHELEKNELTEPAKKAGVQAVNRLGQYNKDIHLPYEYKEATASWDFQKIFAYLKGYPADIEELAPDVDLDFSGSGTEEDKAEFQEIQLDASWEQQWLITEYCLGMFRNFGETMGEGDGDSALNLRGEPKQHRFLRNEIEFILCGQNNEYRNVEGTRKKLVLLRAMLNAAYLLTDDLKRMEIEALASATGGILLPGIGNGLAFGMIVMIWSWGEAIQDYQALIFGNKVPIWKDDQTWKTDLETILSMEAAGETGENKGLDYQQYLRFLLYMVSEEQIIDRVQQLLSINHQKLCLEEMAVTFGVEGTAVSGAREYSFTGTYGYEE